MRRKPPLHYTANNQVGRLPVILLSGLSLKWQFMRRLGDKLSLAGHPVYIVPNLGRNFLSIPESAELVWSVMENHQLRKVIIVAHSKGGLIGKYLMIHHDKTNRIKTIITIATPFNGTTVARIVPRASFREVLPSSPIITELQKNKTVNKRIVSIAPEYDNHMRPKQSSYLEGAQNITVKVRGHHRVVLDKTVEEKVLSLAKGITK